MWVAFANAKATHIFFNKNFSLYVILNGQSFNDTLTTSLVLNNWALINTIWSRSDLQDSRFNITGAEK